MLNLTIIRCLHFEQPGISSTRRDQLAMSSLLTDAPAFDDDDPVGNANRGEAVGNQQHGPAFRQFGEPLEDFEFRGCIEMTT